MRHFVQYHNPDRNLPYRPRPGICGIYTSKSVSNLIGDRIWLVTRSDAPRAYYLCETFVVDRVKRGGGRQPNTAWGRDGLVFKPLRRIDGTNWFDRLRTSTGNFAFGLSRVVRPDIIRGLRGDLASAKPHGATRPGADRGAGFGSPAENRRVERAAVTAVTKRLRAEGWTVTSVEAARQGFDLRCTRGTDELHAEVKGVRGSHPSFIITAGELEAARYDRQFALFVVTNALRPAALHIVSFTGREFLTRYSREPLSYMSKPLVV